MFKLVAAAAVCAALSTGAVRAEPVYQIGQGYTVRHPDLDLSTPEGRRALLQRVERAAQRACAGHMLRRDQESCARETLRLAIDHAAPAARNVLRLAVAEQSPSTFAAR